MIERAMYWSLALCVLVPATLTGQQANAGLVTQGAQVYSNNCARCHNARSSMERTDAEWRVIVGHMRVRANMTRAQAEAVLAYLQATNAPEGGSRSGGAGADRDRRDLQPVVLPPALRIDPPLLRPVDARGKPVRRAPLVWSLPGSY